MTNGTIVPYFVTGIGTDVGKTLVAAILVKALNAYYWKPVQAGGGAHSDQKQVQMLTNMPPEREIPERYKLLLPASPHWAAREENKEIELASIHQQFLQIVAGLEKKHPGEKVYLIIEGAGGLLVPLNNNELVADLIRQLNIPVLLVSRHYLGSINHSLLTASYCKQNNIALKGWIFNDGPVTEVQDQEKPRTNTNYATEISVWTKTPILAQLPYQPTVDAASVEALANQWSADLKAML